MYNSEALQEKWQPVLNHPDLPAITDSYKRAVTAVILENQEKELKKLWVNLQIKYTTSQKSDCRQDILLFLVLLNR